MTDREKRVVEIVTQDVARAEAAMAPRMEEYEEFYRLYCSCAEARKGRRANMFVPHAQVAVDRLLARILFAFFSAPPLIGVEARGPDQVEAARLAETLVENQLDREQIFMKLHDAFKNALIYERGVLKNGWRVEREETETEVEEPVLFLGAPVGTRVRTALRDEAVYNGPDLRAVDLRNFFQDPDSVNVGDSWAAERIVTDLAHLREAGCGPEGRVYRNAAEVEAGMREGGGAADCAGRPACAAPGKVELIEYWGLLPWEEDGVERTRPCVATVANRTVCVRFEPNPFRHGRPPYNEFFINRKPGEPRGFGAIEPIRSLQYEANDKRNQRLDNVNLILNRMWRKRRGARVTPWPPVSAPGAVIESDTMQDIEPIEMPDVTASAYQEEEIILRDIERTVGLTDADLGLEGRAPRTATEIVARQEGGSQAVDLIVRTLEQGLIDMARMVLSNNAQFLAAGELAREVGAGGEGRFVTVPAWALKRRFNLRVRSSRLHQLKDRTRQALNQLIGLTGSHPVFAEQVDARELLRAALDTFPEIQGRETILKPAFAAGESTAAAGAGWEGNDGRAEV